MSTYWYLECLDHDPPLRSVDEVEQHTYGLERVRELVTSRDAVISGLDVGLEAERYFDRNTVAFIRTHPHCRYRLISEYGETEDLPLSGAVRLVGERKTLPGTSGQGEDEKSSQTGKIGDSRTGEQEWRQ